MEKKFIFGAIKRKGYDLCKIVSLVLMFATLSFSVYAVQTIDQEQILVPATSLSCISCGSTTPDGTININCYGINDFECMGMLKDDLGNEVKVWCINKTFYACLYIPKNGKQRFVGRCPFGGGRNSLQLYVIPDNNNNGKFDHIQGTVWISRDGPDPLYEGGYTDDDGDGDFDRWSYTYNAISDKVKQDNLECNDYHATSCSIAETETKKPKEECFVYTDLKPNPYTSSDESVIVSTRMAFPANVVVRERFVFNLAHAEVSIQPEREMKVEDFLNLLVAEVQDNCYLNRTVGITPEYHFDEQQQQHIVTIKCIDPQEIAIREADIRLQRLDPVRNLQAIYDRESGQVHINWEPGDEYDTIVIWRNGNRISDYYSGEMRSFTDDFKSSPLDFLRQKRLYGIHTYTVFGIRGGVHSIARDVQVNVEPPESIVSKYKHGFSFALGIALPSVTFDGFKGLRNPGINVIVDYHLQLHPNLSFLGMIGFNNFSSTGGLENTYLWNFSCNLRYYPISGKNLKPYFGGGPGYYKGKGDKGRFGYNLSAGLDYELTSSLDLEIGGDYHRIHISDSDIKFMHFHVGLIIKF